MFARQYPLWNYVSTTDWYQFSNCATYILLFSAPIDIMNTISIFRYRFRVVALNDAGPSEAGEPSEPVVIDVPGVQIAPYFVHTLNDTMALENDTVCY